MDDYISREDAVNVVANTAKIVASFNYQYAIDALLALTPADVVPVVHARWVPIVSYSNTYKCSECGRLLVDIADDFCETRLPDCPLIDLTDDGK